jgi:signal transduction histidine kinase
MRKQLEATVDMVRAGHLEARRNIAALRPGNLEQMGLAKALEEATKTIVRDGPIAIQLSVRGDPKPLPFRISDTLFRIGQEAVANAVSHARPQTIRLRLVYGRSSIKLTVWDDGNGFSPLVETSGFGIRGMKRRADTIAASFRIRSLPGCGTYVVVRAIMPRSMLSMWWWRATHKGKWRRWLHGKS